MTSMRSVHGTSDSSESTYIISHPSPRGKIIAQTEQQRLAMDSEQRAVLSELQVLLSELGYKCRRGIAQLLITLVIAVLGVSSRSSTSTPSSNLP
jgi:hypothetical protein